MNINEIITTIVFVVMFLLVVQRIIDELSGKTPNLVAPSTKFFGKFLLFILFITSVLSFIYTLYSIVANIIHFNILIAVGWTIAAFVTFIFIVAASEWMDKIK